jgi:DNA-binding CsgD family transcriptional regulator
MENLAKTSALLDKRALAAYTAFAVSANVVTSWQQLDAWCLTRLRDFIPFELMICAAGTAHYDAVHIEMLRGIGYPDDYMAAIAKNFRIAERSLVNDWLATRKVQIVDSDTRETKLSELERGEFDRMDMRLLLAHGVVDADDQRGTYFSLAKLPAEPHDVLAEKMRLAAPVLHAVVTGLRAQDRRALNAETQHANLSPVEIEVLLQLISGHTNKQIAQQLSKSPETVKHQISALMRKFGARNRAHLVALLGTSRPTLDR